MMIKSKQGSDVLTFVTRRFSIWNYISVALLWQAFTQACRAFGGNACAYGALGGLGANAMLFGGDFSRIGWFSQHYEAFMRPPIATEQSPSALIADTLMGRFCAKEHVARTQERVKDL